MTRRDFLILSLCCFLWGANLAMTRWAIAHLGVQPLFFAGLRFLIVAILLAPFLRPLPKNLGTLFGVSLLIGSLNFGMLFVGLGQSEVSAAAVVGQLGVPISTLMSMIFLGEDVRWRRWLGILLAFAGVVIIAFNPATFSVSTGLLFVLGAALLGSSGGIIMKKMEPMHTLRLQAWVALFSFGPVFALSALFETQQIDSYIAAGWPAWGASLFAAVAVTIVAHGLFYNLLKKYDVSLLSPLCLMTPLWGVVLGITFLNEPFTPRLILGGTISLMGVLVIALRPNRVMPEAALGKKIGGGDS